MADRIQGILFDLGDTLLDFGEVDVNDLFESGARLAYDYLKELGKTLPSFARYHRRQLRAIRWNYFKSRFTRREFNALDLIGSLSSRMGHDLTHTQTIELAWLWYKPLSDCATIEPGTRETLMRLRQDGLVLGLVSNTFIPGEVLDRHLKAEGLLEFLPARIYSCDVRYRKPNPNIFTEALRRCGLRPEETLFVGDSLRADVDGANRAGLISVLKDRSGDNRNARIRPQHRISRLTELPDVVGLYNRR